MRNKLSKEKINLPLKLKSCLFRHKASRTGHGRQLADNWQTTGQVKTGQRLLLNKDNPPARICKAKNRNSYQYAK